MGSRIVVTGWDSDGRSVVADDRAVDASHIGEPPVISVTNLAVAETMKSPSAGIPASSTTFFPSACGLRVALLEWAPRTYRPATSTEDYAKVRDDILIGYEQAARTDAEGLHATQTVDVGWVIEGELTLELSDGVTTILRAGDTLVQNATAHRWSNLSDRPCRALFAMVGLRGDNSP